MNHTHDENFFPIHGNTELFELRFWLETRDFNYADIEDRIDKRGKPIIPLFKKVQKQDGSYKMKKRGVVWCVSDSLREKAIEIIEEFIT